MLERRIAAAQQDSHHAGLDVLDVPLAFAEIFVLHLGEHRAEVVRRTADCGLGVEMLVPDPTLHGGIGHGVFQKEQVIGENVGRDAVRIGLELRGQLLDLSARLGKGRPIAD